MARRETADTIYYDKEKVSKCLEGEWQNILLLIEGSLKSYSAGKVSQPVRAAVQIKEHDGLLLAMPAYDSELDSLATKVVTVFPENKKKGLSSVQSVVLLYNAADGKLKAILDGEVITSMRTAAASAVATKYLASKESKHLAILGAGTQARSHYQALGHIYNFEKIFIWNINTENAMKLRDEIQETGKQCIACHTVKEAVETADIIVTATMAQKPILKKEWVKMGTHINAVGAPVPEWQELESDLMLSSVIYVDSREAALAESGDVIQSKADIYAEIGEVILGLKEPYVHKTTVFKSLGMAVEDVVTAELVYQILQKRNF